MSEKEPRQRYAYLDAIFFGREGESVPHEARISMLVRLCSLAVQFPGCQPLLNDVGAWLQKVGLVKPYARQIVAKLVDDFCHEQVKGKRCGDRSVDSIDSFGSVLQSMTMTAC